MRLFSQDWAQAWASELGRDQRFLQSARLLRAVVRWRGPSGGVDLVVGSGRVGPGGVDGAVGSDGGHGGTGPGGVDGEVGSGGGRDGADRDGGEVGPARVTAARARLADGFDFGLTAPEAVWLELFSQPRASLNQLVRRGDIGLIGDRVAVLLWWKPVFLMAQAGRRLAGLGSGPAAEPEAELKRAPEAGPEDEPGSESKEAV
ncbi:MAG: hypothetical protein LBL55_02980 [Propionibacteriaceae bacterium]|jgi:hypothetical protein|nr:hypothetical protein [Propionibacteriaceae bacterium]